MNIISRQNQKKVYSLKFKTMSQKCKRKNWKNKEKLKILYSFKIYKEKLRSKKYQLRFNCQNKKKLIGNNSF